VTRITFEHHFDAELGMYVFTSPDVRGFRATGKTVEEAQRAAVALMDLVRKDRSDRVIRTVEYATA
jgi:predicted RNase H-like HicB family nuclease